MLRRENYRGTSLHNQGFLSLDKDPISSSSNVLHCMNEEEQLEEIVFGRQPFITNKDAQSEEEEDSRPKRSKVSEGAWTDEDDDIIKVDLITRGGDQLRKSINETTVSGREYSSRLRESFQKISRPPEWSIDIPQKHNIEEGYSSGEEESEGQELLKGTGSLLSDRVSVLPRDTIDIRRLKDANHQKPSPAVLQSVEFHPSAHVILTAGRHKTLNLFQVDGTTNPLLQSVHLEHYPIITAHFTPNGEEVITAGDRHWFYVFDMISGKVIKIHEIRGHGKKRFSHFRVSPDNQYIAFIGSNGYIPLVSNKTKQWIADLKVNGEVRDVSFTPDNKYLLSTGTDANVYVWDLTTRDCVHRFTDDGCVKGTSLSVSPNGSHVACASDSGVVNLYDNTCLLQRKPRPVKSIMNLTTSVTGLSFNHTSEVLALSSNCKMAAFKLFHVPSRTVFSNWPLKSGHLKTIFSHDFSPDSHYMVLGNDQGKALLYRLNHYHTGYSEQ